MRVKICGLCSPADARLAERAGAMYGGVILAPIGPRRQTVETAAGILAGASELRRVGVFVDADVESVETAARRLSLDVLQLHGSEDAAAVERLRASGPWRVWKAVRLRCADDFVAAIDAWASRVDGLLIDGWSAAAPGGVGASFSWRDVAPLRSRMPAGVELIVAGGLNPDNVAAAIAALLPDAVDVSSGVEESPGRKSDERVRAFVAAAQAAAGGVPVVRNGSR